MPSPTARLEEVLQELQELLEDAPDLDPEQLAELRDAASEIRAVIGDLAEEESLISSLGDRLSDAVQRFEETHPRLTQVIGRVADALSDLGI